MKINIYLKTIATCLVITLSLASCGDDFVELSPQYSIDSENFFNSEDDYYSALVAAYDMLQSSYVNVILGEIASNNTLCGGESPTDVIGWQQIDDMIHTSNNGNLHDIWKWMFAGVQRTNYFMEFRDKIEFEGRAEMIGEVQFLRAYYHFELVKWFGGIPMKVNERFQLGDETSIPRSSVAEVYAQIELDLIFASENLPYIQAEKGRITKGAAQALLGKAYLYQNKFDEASIILENLILNGPYALVADATNFMNMFENLNENNIESVFEVQYVENQGAGFGCLQCSEGNVAVGFQGIRGYTGPNFTSGFSFNIPVQELVDAFEMDDRRIDVTILDIDAWSQQTGATFDKGYEHTGYFNRKYLPRSRGADAQGDRNLTNPNNYRAIRFADVLLMAAEAFNRKNDPEDVKAQDYLNRVRQRAFGDMMHNLSSTGTSLTEDIFKERRLELAGEGHRFFDLVRTEKAAEKITGFIAGKHELFPIPAIEIQLTGNRWTQNPNY